MSYNTDLQSNNAELEEILNEINELPEETADAVRYTEQVLTDEQKAQARTNIGAASQAELEDELEELTPSIVQAVLAELQGSPVFGVVDAENNITISGNLANGTYTLKYENADGTTTEIGTLVVGGSVEPVDSNVFDPATATLNQRWSNSSYAWVAENGYVVSDYIPVSLSTDASNPTMLHFRGGAFAGNANIVFYNSSKGVVQSATASTNGVGMTPATIAPTTDENGDYQLQLGYKNNVFDSNWTSGVAYMRVGLQVNASGTAITAADIQGIKMTINELIAD